MVVLRSLSLSPPRPDTTLSSKLGGLVPARNFPDKLRYRRRAALGEERLADLRAGAGWWAWSPLMGCVILAVSALEKTRVGDREEEHWGRGKRADYDIWFSEMVPMKLETQIHYRSQLTKNNHCACTQTLGCIKAKRQRWALLTHQSADSQHTPLI